MPKSQPRKNYLLQPCCIVALEEIRDKQELGKILQAVLAATPFTFLIGSNPIEASVSLGTFDWEILAKAMKGVPGIVRNRCKQIAGFQILKHKSGPLNKFWREMYDSF